MGVGLLSLIKSHPSKEGKGSPGGDSTPSLVHVSPRLEDFNFIQFKWEERHLDTHHSQPQKLRGLFLVKKEKGPPPCPTSHRLVSGISAVAPVTVGCPPTLTCGWSACLYRQNLSWFV